jgi:hypothetical protein
LFSSSDYAKITLRHLYLLTSGKRPKAIPVEVEVTREHVEAEWQKILLIIREMAAWGKLAPETADPKLWVKAAEGWKRHGAKIVMLYPMYRMPKLDDQIATLRRVKEVLAGV